MRNFIWTDLKLVSYHFFSIRASVCSGERKTKTDKTNFIFATLHRFKNIQILFLCNSDEKKKNDNKFYELARGQYLFDLFKKQSLLCQIYALYNAVKLLSSVSFQYVYEIHILRIQSLSLRFNVKQKKCQCISYFYLFLFQREFVANFSMQTKKIHLYDAVSFHGFESFVNTEMGTQIWLFSITLDMLIFW